MKAWLRSLLAELGVLRPVVKPRMASFGSYVGQGVVVDWPKLP
jgi:hypothetical protein